LQYGRGIVFTTTDNTWKYVKSNLSHTGKVLDDYMPNDVQARLRKIIKDCTNIRRVCNGERNIAGEYRWVYSKDK
jgi:hypothetical protein